MQAGPASGLKPKPAPWCSLRFLFWSPPGIQFADVHELIEKGIEVLILSRGVFGRLKIQDDILNKLETDRIKVYILKTHEAVKLYNDLRESKRVGALIHTTC